MLLVSILDSKQDMTIDKNFIEYMKVLIETSTAISEFKLYKHVKKWSPIFEFDIPNLQS